MVKHEKHFFSPQELRAAFLSLFVLIVLTGYPANIPNIVTTIEGTLSTVDANVSAAAAALSAPRVTIVYASDLDNEMRQELERLTSLNNFLSSVNSEMFSLYARSFERLMTAAAFDADAGQVVFDAIFGPLVDSHVAFSISAAAALNDAYNDSFDGQPLSLASVSVASSELNVDLNRGVKHSLGGKLWDGAIFFVSNIFSSADVLAEKYTL
jgi:hypothetical protein